jgi:hypothetical protein
VPLSLGPVPEGEIAHVIREPAEILRRKVGLSGGRFLLFEVKLPRPSLDWRLPLTT